MMLCQTSYLMVSMTLVMFRNILRGGRDFYNTDGFESTGDGSCAARNGFHGSRNV